MLWVDTDGCVSAAQYCKYFVSSVTKGIQASVKTGVLAAAKGTFKGGDYIGDLANDGVVLSPFHDFASKVPSSLQSQLNTIKQQIISGQIKPGRPRARFNHSPPSRGQAAGRRPRPRLAALG